MNLSTGLISPIQINSTARGSQAQLVLPVQRNDSYYAQYKHVKGVPVPGSQSYVPLERLQIIDNMIDALQSIRSMNSRQQELLKSGLEQAQELTASQPQLDRVINQLGEEIHENLVSIPPAFTSDTQSSAAAGLAFQVEI